MVVHAAFRTREISQHGFNILDKLIHDFGWEIAVKGETDDAKALEQALQKLGKCKDDFKQVIEESEKL
eukprot:1135755-Amphidinium_carterae.1